MNLSVSSLLDSQIAANDLHTLKRAPSIAVGIVLFNNSVAELADLARTLNRALSRLAENENHKDSGFKFSIRLKNNGETPVDLKMFGPHAQLFGSSENWGFGRSHNLLMREAFADGVQFYLALNPDGMLHPEALIEIFLVSRRNGDRALVEAAQFPEELPKSFDPLTLDTSWASGCCLLIPISIYSSIGGFDENMFLYCEDVDFSWRALQAGFSVKHAPGALIHHLWNRFGTSNAILCEHRNAARYLGIKWGNEAFARKMESDLLEMGCAIREIPAAMPHQLVSSIADFSPGFAPERWGLPSPIPIHVVAERVGVDDMIDVIVRFDDATRLGRLSRCLFSLYSQQHQPIQVLLMLHDFDDANVAATNACVDAFDWSAPRKRPIVTNVSVPSVDDHRSLLWDAGVQIGRSRYLGFCDVDDVIYSGGYSYLLHRIQDTGAAAVFGAALLVDCSPMHGLDFVFAKRLPAGEGHYDSLVRNYSPPACVLLDRSRIEAQDLRANFKISQIDDRHILALIVTKYQTDGACVGTVVAERTNRTNGSNTVLSHRTDMSMLRD